MSVHKNISYKILIDVHAILKYGILYRSYTVPYVVVFETKNKIIFKDLSWINILQCYMIHSFLCDCVLWNLHEPSAASGGHKIWRFERRLGSHHQGSEPRMSLYILAQSDNNRSGQVCTYIWGILGSADISDTWWWWPRTLWKRRFFTWRGWFPVKSSTNSAMYCIFPILLPLKIPHCHRFSNIHDI